MSALQRNEALAQLDAVHEIMARASGWSRLPAFAAVLSGALCLAACLWTRHVTGTWDLAVLMEFQYMADGNLIAIWPAVLAVSVAAAVGSLWKGETMPRTIKQMSAILVPVVMVAAMVTSRAFYDLQLHLVVPIWALCWGAGVFALGALSGQMAARIMGALFMTLGGIGLLYYPQIGLLLGAITFGGLHIAFGLFLLLGQRRASAS